MNSHDINRLLREAIAELPQEAEPTTIAALALHRIPASDRDEALLVLLENQLTRVYAYDRAPLPSRQRANSVAALRDRGIDPVEADKSMTMFSPMAQRLWARGKARKISQEEAREQIEREDDARRKAAEERVRGFVSEIAETNRKADIAEALNRRVMVRKSYKMLLDCTLDEVEWLANNATNLALGHLHAAAFYEDIANRMREHGAETAGQIIQVAA